ncbi:hypothetical protein AA313_de0205758 [Arthrobotrys entomopaga]|nr:hypothetical protein AA313_de0205758 [Arthrobotrys entomopaga]
MFTGGYSCAHGMPVNVNVTHACCGRSAQIYPIPFLDIHRLWITINNIQRPTRPPVVRSRPGQTWPRVGTNTTNRQNDREPLAQGQEHPRASMFFQGLPVLTPTWRFSPGNPAGHGSPPWFSGSPAGPCSSVRCDYACLDQTREISLTGTLGTARK